MMKILVDLSITILVAILSGLFTFLIKKFKIDVKFKTIFTNFMLHLNVHPVRAKKKNL